MFYYSIGTAVIGGASSILGFFMLGFKDLKGIVAGVPYVVFGLLTFPFGHHLAPVAGGWSTLLYVLGAFSMLFGLIVICDEGRAKAWFTVRYLLFGMFFLVIAFLIPEVTSSMRMFPALAGLAYFAIAASVMGSGRFTGAHVGFDVALNGACFLFLGMLLASVPDFFLNPGPSIDVP